MSDVFLFTFFGLYYTTRFRLYFPRHSSRDPSKFRCNKIHFNVVCDKEFNNHVFRAESDICEDFTS